MTPNEYLSKILDDQTLAEDSAELKQLRDRRGDVEDVLRDAFGSSPTIRYGGSKSKGTIIKEAYDLDIICYFPRDDDDAAGTLQDVYTNVQNALGKRFVVLPKTSAIRLQSQNYQDFHVDVVPGRFVDDGKEDAFLHRTTGDKKRLKTNLDVHIEHVKGSGVVPAVRLSKLWRVRSGLAIRHFGLELLAIKLAKEKKASGLDVQMEHVWRTLRDDIDSIGIEDPANPNGNDLSELLSDSVRQELSASASRTLSTIDRNGWEAVFGKLAVSEESKHVAIREVARTVSAPSRPWCRR